MWFNRKLARSLLATFGGYKSSGDRDGARLNFVGAGNVVALSVREGRSDRFFGWVEYSVEFFGRELSRLPEICRCDVGGGTGLRPPLCVVRPCSTIVSARQSIFIPQPARKCGCSWNFSYFRFSAPVIRSGSTEIWCGMLDC